MTSEFVEIANKQGLSATLLPYGATLAKLNFVDRNGKVLDLVLGFDSVEEFKKDTQSLGKTVGRVANRIRNSQILFDGQKFELEKNNGPHFLHSGPNGLGYKTWEIVRHSPQSVSFSVRTDQSDDGLPGDAKIDVTYTVNDRNQLLVEHYAKCQRPGILALTNHAYWNLDGSEKITDHLLEVNSEEFVEIDETSCPTGAIRPVSGTQLDFRSGRKIGSENGKLVELDHDLVIANEKRELKNSQMRFWSPKSGIEMSVTTSYPVIHLYSSQFLNVTGKKGEFYGPNKALAIEPQFHSAAANFDNFPDVSLRPGEQYCQEIVYTFSHLDN